MGRHPLFTVFFVVISRRLLIEKYYSIYCCTVLSALRVLCRRALGGKLHCDTINNSETAAGAGSCIRCFHSSQVYVYKIVSKYVLK